MKKRKYSVPYTVKYHKDPLSWEVTAYDKGEARIKTVSALSTDSDVTHIASTAHIVSLGEVRK